MNIVVASILAGIWVAAAVLPSSRNWRFFAALVPWTVVTIAMSALPLDVGRILFAAAIFIAVYGVVSPYALGLGSMTRDEERADATLRVAWRALATPHGPEEPPTAAAQLDPECFPRQSLWRPAARLLRRAAMPGLHRSNATSTPSSAFLRAGVAIWNVAQQQHVIRGQRVPSAWDEDLLLRCYQDEFTDLVPREALVEYPIVPLGAWDNEASHLVDELAAVPLGDHKARKTRESLVEAMRALLAVAQGDRSAEAMGRQDLTARSLGTAWQELASYAEAEADGPATSRRGPTGT